MAPIDLTGARVLVLGGSGVIGSSIARELASRGSDVVLSGRDEDRLRERAGTVGGGVRSVLADLRHAHHAPHVVRTAVEMLGGLDGVVNAAGVVAFGPLAEMSDDAIDEIVATDLAGPLRVMREAIGHMDGGFFVSISGVVAETSMPGMAVYSAAKAGLSAAMRALAKELRRHGIHCLDARPPHTETGLAGRPISGTAPSMSEGLSPDHVATVIVDGLVAGERELPASAF